MFRMNIFFFFFFTAERNSTPSPHAHSGDKFPLKLINTVRSTLEHLVLTTVLQNRQKHVVMSSHSKTQFKETQ